MHASLVTMHASLATMHASLATMHISLATRWIRALEEPSRGAEAFTEVDIDSLGDELDALTKMIDMLLLEHDSLLVFVA